jgi:hypothetical protein
VRKAILALSIIALTVAACDVHQSQPVYQQPPVAYQQPTVVYQQPTVVHDGAGVGTGLIAGAALGYMAGSLANSANYRQAPGYGPGWYTSPSGQVIQQKIVNNTYVYVDRSGKTIAPPKDVKPDSVKEHAAQETAKRTAPPTFAKPTFSQQQMPAKPTNVPIQTAPAPARAPIFTPPARSNTSFSRLSNGKR